MLKKAAIAFSLTMTNAATAVAESTTVIFENHNWLVSRVIFDNNASTCFSFTKNAEDQGMSIWKGDTDDYTFLSITDQEWSFLKKENVRINIDIDGSLLHGRASLSGKSFLISGLTGRLVEGLVLGNSVKFYLGDSFEAFAEFPLEGSAAAIMNFVNCLETIAVEEPQDEAPSDETAALILRWTELDEQCRGGHGNDPATLQACDERKTVQQRMESLGLCHEGPTSTGAWAMCGETVAVPDPQDQAPSGETAALLSWWLELDNECRGGHGNDPDTLQACDERKTVQARIESLGLCYDGSAQGWVVC